MRLFIDVCYLKAKSFVLFLCQDSHGADNSASESESEVRETDQLVFVFVNKTLDIAHPQQAIFAPVQPTMPNSPLPSPDTQTSNLSLQPDDILEMSARPDDVQGPSTRNNLLKRIRTVKVNTTAKSTSSTTKKTEPKNTKKQTTGRNQNPLNYKQFSAWKYMDQFHNLNSSLHFLEQPGPSRRARMNASDPFETFRLLFDGNVIKILLDETNRYHAQCTNDDPDPTWTDVHEEMMAFLCLVLAMGVVNLPELTDY